jgi:prophage regulatory protein
MLRFLRLPEVADVTGLSPTTIWRREKEGRFPRRRRVGPNAVAWRSDEVEAWIRGRPEVEEEPAAGAVQ